MGAPDAPEGVWVGSGSGSTSTTRSALQKRSRLAIPTSTPLPSETGPLTQARVRVFPPSLRQP